jgi:hypothetical protein
MAYVSGGVVQAARADSPNIRFEVCDQDNIDDEDADEEDDNTAEYEALPYPIY